MNSKPQRKIDRVKKDKPMNKLKFGMIGGGPGAFIGDIHRKAAEFDGLGQLAAGCFSRNYDKSLAYGREHGLEEDRIYRSFEEMAAGESARPDGIDFVIVAAPNHVHYECCKAFLEHGIHVVCDKPVTNYSREAEELKALAEAKGLLFAVTYPYAAMPAASFMKQMIEEGGLGDLLLIKGEYLSDNLLQPNAELNSGMLWRINPGKAGQSTCCADIGVHLQNLIRRVTGLNMEELSADMNVIGEDRTLDTNFTATVRYDRGVKGHLWCSNVAAGRYNDLNIAVYGTKGSLVWSLEGPDIVTFGGVPGQTVQYRMGRTGAGDRDENAFRLPAGQSEGYYLAFANIYRAFMTDLARAKAGLPLQKGYPGIDEGLESMRFVEACIASSKEGGAWKTL